MRQLSTPQLLPSSPPPARKLSATSGWLPSPTLSRPTTAASPPQPRLPLSLNSGQPLLGLVSPSTLAPDSPLSLVAPLASALARPHLPLGLGSGQSPLGLGSGQPPRPWLFPLASTPESDSLSADDRCQPPLGLVFPSAFVSSKPDSTAASVPTASASDCFSRGLYPSLSAAPKELCQLHHAGSRVQAPALLSEAPGHANSSAAPLASASALESDSLSADDCCQPPSASAPLGLGSEQPPSASSLPWPQLRTAPPWPRLPLGLGSE